MASTWQNLARRLAPEGKAIQAHPALMDRDTPLAIVGQGSGRNEARLTQREASRHLDAYGGHETIDWLMMAVDLVATSASGAGFQFVKDGKTQLSKKDPQQPETPLIDVGLGRLMEQPNPHQDYAEWLELLLIDLLLVGNAYAYKFAVTDDKPLALYRLAPPHVKVVPASWGVKRYEYQLPGQREPLEIDPTRVIHWRLPNPHNPFYGLGKVQKIGRPADLELALTESQASYYENGARPSIVVQGDRRVPRDVMRKLKAQLRARSAGADKSGELMILEAGLTASTIDTSAQEKAFEPLTRVSRDRIWAAFHASPKLFGVLDEAGGADKMNDAQRVFDNKMMKPLLKKFQTKLSAQLTQAWDADFVIPYEYVMPIEDRWRLVGSIAQIPGVMVDDVRVAAGLGQHPDKTIGTMTLNLPGEDAPSGGHPDIPDQNLPGERGRPPKPSNTRAFPRNGDPLPKSAEVRAGKSLPELVAELERLAEAKAVESPPAVQVGRLEGEEPGVDLLAGRREADVDVIVADLQRTLGDAAHVLERGLLDHAEGKAGLNTVRQRIRNSGAWKDFRGTVEGALVDTYRRLLSTAATHQGTLGNRTDVDYDAIAQRLAARPEARNIVKTFQNQVSTKVGDALKGGGDADVERAIRDAVSEWQTSQAETIALSEAVEGYNEGTLEVADGLGIAAVTVHDGHDHDAECAEADGQVWTIDFAREHRKAHPRCRRAFSFA